MGSVFFVYALIRLEIDWNSSEWYYTPDSTLLDMKEYGIAMLFAGIIAWIVCVSNIYHINSEEQNLSVSENAEKSKAENFRLEDEIEDMDIDEIEAVIEKHTKKNT